ALRIRRKAYGPKHSNVALSLQVLARALHQTGPAKEAETLFREALVTLRDTKHWSQSHCEIGLGRLLVSTGRSAEAEPLLADALATRIANDGETSAPADEARLALGLCRLAQGRAAEARDLLAPALERQQGTNWAEADVLAEARAALSGLTPTAR
ncbi:MAG TPA: tetratricopeptide repeat protein, partial [Vicinamibacteria bacterium]